MISNIDIDLCNITNSTLNNSTLNNSTLNNSAIMNPVLDDIIVIPPSATLNIDGYYITSSDLREKLEFLDKLINANYPI